MSVHGAVKAASEVGSLFEPQIVLPVQMSGGGESRRTGAVGLLWALLVDGVRVYCTEILAGRRAGLAYRETERWIFDSESLSPTSFAGLCQIFDLDARSLRRGLLEFRDHPRPRIPRIVDGDAVLRESIGFFAGSRGGSPAMAAAGRRAGGELRR